MTSILVLACSSKQENKYGSFGSANNTSGAAVTSGTTTGIPTGTTQGATATGTTGASTTGTGTTGNVPIAGDVVFSVPSGTFQTPFSVGMSSAQPGAEIHYTLDGSPATGNSTLYNGQPIQVSTTTEINANVFVNGVASGNPSTVIYIARSIDASSNLSLVLIDAYGAGEPGENQYETTAFMVFDPPAAQLSLPPSVATRAGIHVRGQSSADFDKKGYRVELWDNLDQDVDLPLAGMPAQSDWVLHGPFVDKTLIRNAFVYSLGVEMGLTAPRFAFTELYLNTSNRPLESSDYLGVYLLVETIKNAPARLNLAQLNDTDTMVPDITGGYIFKFELDVAEQPILTCSGGGQGQGGGNCWQDLEVYDPSPITPVQQTWLNDHIQAFHNALFANTFTDPTLGYAPYVDVASFVNYLVLTEVTRDLDGYIRSMYLHKNREAPIVVGPLWDYNLSMATGCCDSNLSTSGWQYEVPRNGDANGWCQRMLEDPTFAAMVSARYRALRASILSDAQIDARINALSGPLTEAAARNFQRWPNLTQGRITFFDSPTDATFSGQIETMRSWLKQRLSWIDTQW